MHAFSPAVPSKLSVINSESTATLNTGDDKAVVTAIIYCEANLGEVDGKTANGLVRHSEK